MRNNAVHSRWHRAATGFAIALLTAGAAVGSAQVAAADPLENSTPETATTFTSVPYESVPEGWREAPAATDPAAQVVAAGCNDGNAISGTAWWKYTAPSNSTVVVHAGELVGGVVMYQPLGLAVVSADRQTVISCGREVGTISDAGSVTVEAGASVYIVTYLPVVQPDRVISPVIGVYPSTGVAPTNDDYTSPLEVTSLPFTVTQDTTLATRQPAEPGCYNKFGNGPSVWYSITPSQDQVLDLTITSDYQSDFVIVPDGTFESSSSWICGENQFQAEAGVTYLIGVYGFNDLKNSGQLTVSIAEAPAAPAVEITLAANGTVTRRTGVVTLTGTVTCTASAQAQAVTGTLRQVYKRSIHQQSFTGPVPACTGQPETWTAEIAPTDFIFKGKTKVTASVTACTSGGCTTANAERAVNLRVG